MLRRMEATVAIDSTFDPNHSLCSHERALARPKGSIQFRAQPNRLVPT